MNEDLEQLRRYADSGAEDAFAAVVHRYLPLVYRAALRRLNGDAHRAEDVTQMVFTALARNARSLARRSDLAGWLFTTTRYLAGRAIRTEVRRHAREKEAHMTHSLTTEASPESALAPLHAVLDDVMIELNQVDRQVLLLRYHQGLRLAEIGVQLGLTDNAVQKRMERALDRLKDMLARRGISSTATAVALAFEQQAAVAVPAGLAAAATSAGLTSGAVAAGLAGFSSFLAISKVQFGVIAAVVAAGSAGLVWEHRENTRLRAEVVRQTAAAQAQVAELGKSLDVQSKRAAAAEADVSALLKAVQAAGPSRAAASQPAAGRGNDRNAARAELVNAGTLLLREAKPQDALEKLLGWYREFHAEKADSPECQIVMGLLASLGQSYPAATVALRDLRDTALQKFAAKPADRAQAVEIALLNDRLQEGHRTLSLYDALPVDSSLRQAFAAIAHKSFVEARRYSDAMVGKTFGSMLNELEMNARSNARPTGRDRPYFREQVIEPIARNIEVLTGTGKLDEARTLTEKLLAFDSSDSTRAIIKQHVDRAGQPSAP